MIKERVMKKNNIEKEVEKRLLEHHFKDFDKAMKEKKLEAAEYLLGEIEEMVEEATTLNREKFLPRLEEALDIFDNQNPSDPPKDDYNAFEDLFGASNKKDEDDDDDDDEEDEDEDEDDEEDDDDDDEDEDDEDDEEDEEDDDDDEEEEEDD